MNKVDGAKTNTLKPHTIAHIDYENFHKLSIRFVCWFRSSTNKSLDPYKILHAEFK